MYKQPIVAGTTAALTRSCAAAARRPHEVAVDDDCDDGIGRAHTYRMERGAAVMNGNVAAVA